VSSGRGMYEEKHTRTWETLIVPDSKGWNEALVSLGRKKRYVGDPAIWQNPGVDGESPALQRARNGTQTLKTDITRENIRQAYPTIKKEDG
jgi:hypothetical protein